MRAAGEEGRTQGGWCKPSLAGVSPKPSVGASLRAEVAGVLAMGQRIMKMQKEALRQCG